MSAILQSVGQSMGQIKKSCETFLKLPDRLLRFEPKVRIRVERYPYLIRTVEGPRELERVLRLRYDIFEKEFRKNPIPIGWDTDEYDLLGDHLIIIDQRKNRVVGNYRVISSRDSNRFYSQTEFNMDDLIRHPGTKLELGRACIHPDYRNGAVMSLLWRGVSEYAKQVSASLLFGCASIKSTDPTEVAAIIQDFRDRGKTVEAISILPKEEYQMPELDLSLGASRALPPKGLIPPLLLSYFKAGAKVAPIPAYDRYFQCVDFLTLLDLSQMVSEYEKRYGLDALSA